MVYYFGILQSGVVNDLTNYWEFVQAEYPLETISVVCFVLFLIGYFISTRYIVGGAVERRANNNPPGYAQYEDGKRVKEAKKNRKRRRDKKETTASQRNPSRKKANPSQRKKRSGVIKEINNVKKDDPRRSKRKPTDYPSGSSDKSEERGIANDRSARYEADLTKDKKARKVKVKKSEPVDGAVQKKVSENKKLYVGYKPTDKFEQGEDWTYPVVKMPEENSVIRLPAQGKQQIRGYKEQAFQITLESLFSDFHISGNSLLPVGKDTRPYEPDIALSYRKNNRNIFIDIEIDEPYGGISRHATHVKGDDDIRDYYFTDRGWVVVRFAEIQIHQQPGRCAGLIAKVIHQIAPEISLPDKFIKASLTTEITQWDLLRAQKLEKKNYRENYLEHTFRANGKKVNSDKGVELSELDQEIEKEVIPTTFVEEKPEVPSTTTTNSIWKERDERIEFYPKKHIYLIDGVKATSVSEVVSRFFPEFDSQAVAIKYASNRGIPHAKIPEIIEGWNEKGRRAMEKGTHLHLQIENYLNDDPYEEPEVFPYFLNFINDHHNLYTVKTEWRIFDEQRLIAGTIDYITKNGDGTYSIYDWKRSKKVIDSVLEPKTYNRYQSGIGKLSHIDDTSYNRYCLQQGIYKSLLEEKYHIKIKEMNLVVMHPLYDNYHKVPVKNYSDEVTYMMDAI